MPNKVLKYLKCVKVVEQVWNVKISRSEFNGTMIRIILDPIADPWGWFEISEYVVTLTMSWKISAVGGSHKFL